MTPSLENVIDGETFNVFPSGISVHPTTSDRCLLCPIFADVDSDSGLWDEAEEAEDKPVEDGEMDEEVNDVDALCLRVEGVQYRLEGSKVCEDMMMRNDEGDE